MRISILIMALMLPLTAAAKEPFDGPVLVPARVDRVYDADTVYVFAKDWPESFQRVGARIEGIDTPEKRGTGCKSHPLWKSGKLSDAEKEIIKTYENDLGKAATNRVKKLIKPGDWVVLRNVRFLKFSARVGAELHYAKNIETLKQCVSSLDFSNCPSLGDTLLKEGHAVPYDGGTKAAWWCEGKPIALPRPKGREEQSRVALPRPKWQKASALPKGKESR